MIAADLPLADAIEVVPLSSLTGAKTSASFDVVLAGAIPPNPGDLLDSVRMRELVRAAESKYDLVIIDTPPLSAVSDAISLIPVVSGVMVVSRIDQSTQHAAATFREQLALLDAPVLGVIVNAVARTGGYGYGYGYGNSFSNGASPRREARATTSRGTRAKPKV